MITTVPVSSNVARSFNGTTMLTLFQTAESYVGSLSIQQLAHVLPTKVTTRTPRKYVHTLRKGVRFSDGPLMIADDSWQAL